MLQAILEPLSLCAVAEISGEVPAWLYVCIKVQMTCVWSSTVADAIATAFSLASSNSRMVYLSGLPRFS